MCKYSQNQGMRVPICTFTPSMNGIVKGPRSEVTGNMSSRKVTEQVYVKVWMSRSCLLPPGPEPEGCKETQVSYKEMLGDYTDTKNHHKEMQNNYRVTQYIFKETRKDHRDAKPPHKEIQSNTEELQTDAKQLHRDTK